jgi:hypothetical protein
MAIDPYAVAFSSIASTTASLVFEGASPYYRRFCEGNAFSLAQAFTPGETEPSPNSFGPFRGQGTSARAPKGAKTNRIRYFPRPRRKRLGYGNLRHEGIKALRHCPLRSGASRCLAVDVSAICTITQPARPPSIHGGCKSLSQNGTETLVFSVPVPFW